MMTQICIETSAPMLFPKCLLTCSVKFTESINVLLHIFLKGDNVKLSVDAMRHPGEADVYIHSFLTSALDKE
jgi:hypothetical protein